MLGLELKSAPASFYDMKMDAQNASFLDTWPRAFNDPIELSFLL